MDRPMIVKCWRCQRDRWDGEGGCGNCGADTTETATLRSRIAALEAEVKRLREALREAEPFLALCRYRHAQPDEHQDEVNAALLVVRQALEGSE